MRQFFRAGLRRRAGVLACVFFALSALVSIGAFLALTADDSRAELAPAYRQSVVATGEIRPAEELAVRYVGGRVLLSGSPPPAAPFGADDHLALDVVHPDGTTARWERIFTTDCREDEPIPPEDVTDLFQPGLNTVRVTISDVCGWLVGSLGPVVVSGGIAAERQPFTASWAAPMTALAIPTLLVAAGLGLVADRRRWPSTAAEKSGLAPGWARGFGPIGVLDSTLIAIPSAAARSRDNHPGPLEFGVGPITVGWGEHCGLRMPKARGVAREHARLWLRDGALMINNLVPGYTTRVSGQTVVWSALEEGDEVRIGPYRLRCIDVRAVETSIAGRRS